MLTIQDRPYLWAFYQMLHMVKDFRGAIIAQEEYFTDPKILAKEGRREAYDQKFVDSRFCYDCPTQEDLDKVQKYIIPKEIEHKLIAEKGSYNNAHMFILQNRWSDLEGILEKYLNEIEETNNEKVDALITLCHYPSLEYITEKRGMKLIHIEQGGLREPSYERTAYFDFCSLYGNASNERRFNNFLKETKNHKVLTLTRKEILAIFMKPQSLHYLKEIDKKPEYEMGVALGYATWPLFLMNSYFNDEELLFQVSQNYDIDEFITRKHPADPAKAQYSQYDYNHDGRSMNTIEFILKCKRIASLGSNVSFEAMLFGRTAYTFVPYVSYYMSKHDLKDKILDVVNDEYLNFYVFGYLVPYVYMVDPEYIKWRLTEPSEIEIYNKHLNYWLDYKNIPKNIYSLNKNERYKKILEAVHYDLYDNEPVRKPQKQYSIKQYQAEIKRLNDLLKEANEKNNKDI